MGDRAGRAPRWFTAVIDSGPGVLFIGVFLVTRNFRVATMVLVAAAALALAASLVVERRFRPLPTTVAAMAILFGGASLALRDPQILKMKMSIVDGVVGAALLVGVALKKNPLKMVLGASFALPEKAWATLAIRYGLFWWACAVANEIVRRTQSDHTWVLFRGAALVAALVFALAQTPFLLKHAVAHEPSETPPPGPGA